MPLLTLTLLRLRLLLLQREGAALAAAQEAGIRAELAEFVEHGLPALADVLASRELLLRCFMLLDEEEQSRSSSEGP